MISRFEIFRYRTPDGREPFTEWLLSLQDRQIQARVRVRIRRVEAGLFGDSKPVGDGVIELREHLGPGHRMYFAHYGQVIVVLLCGGSKKTQAADIGMAREYWTDWKRRQT